LAYNKKDYFFEWIIFHLFLLKKEGNWFNIFVWILFIVPPSKGFSKIHMTANTDWLIGLRIYNWCLNSAAYWTNNWDRRSQDFCMTFSCVNT
jgi:hypothetical protein